MTYNPIHTSCVSATWTRRDWLTRNVTAIAAARMVPVAGIFHNSRTVNSPNNAIPSPDWEAVAQRAVDMARRAGAQYADAHVTHTLKHAYGFGPGGFGGPIETIGIGVRALVNGYWGFAATPGAHTAEAERLAQAAVAQAKSNARGISRVVDMGTVPAAVGSWRTPLEIEPFTISIEEKLEFMRYWEECARVIGLEVDTQASYLSFQRREQIVATSDGSRFTQTLYESGGKIIIQARKYNGQGPRIPLTGLTHSGIGWEMVLKAKIPEQIRVLPAAIDAIMAAGIPNKPAQVGRYTVVCDAATMAILLDRTIGIATQLDRAMGYEANASGTSYLNDPLIMLGDFKVASPVVTVTANRSVPGQLATVKWDEEGVEPQPFTLVKDGVLMDYQTTREQATWLAPYYQRVGKPIHSHGCTMIEDACRIPMQHPPNFALAPGMFGSVDDLVSAVPEGILVTEGEIIGADFQGRTGLLLGKMRQIKNGKLGSNLSGGAVLYDSLDLWRRVVAVGNATTQTIVAASTFPHSRSASFLRRTGQYPVKGQPPQYCGYSIQGTAATITNQTVIDPERRA